MLSPFADERSSVFLARQRSSRNNMSETAVPSSSELALTEQFPPMDFRNLQDLAREVDAKREKLQRQDVSQYIAYKYVSSAQFDYIEANRMQLGAVRFTYFSDINTLIVKVPTRPHEVAHRNLERQVVDQIVRMNITIDEFLSLGSTIYTGPTASNKEGDSAFTNPALRPNGTDWPTLVIEAGLSESMPRLRQDAAWWIGNSLGQVHIVLVVKVARSTRTMTIEKYIPRIRVYPNTRARANTTPSFQPSLVSTTVVNDGTQTVQGPPVVLEFQQVIGRAPVPPEGDIRLGQNDLLAITRHVFAP